MPVTVLGVEGAEPDMMAAEEEKVCCRRCAVEYVI